MWMCSSNMIMHVHCACDVVGTDRGLVGALMGDSECCSRSPSQLYTQQATYLQTTGNTYDNRSSSAPWIGCVGTAAVDRDHVLLTDTSLANWAFGVAIHPLHSNRQCQTLVTSGTMRIALNLIKTRPADQQHTRPMSSLQHCAGERAALPVEMATERDHRTGHRIQTDVAVEHGRSVRLRCGVLCRISCRHGPHPDSDRD